MIKALRKKYVITSVSLTVLVFAVYLGFDAYSLSVWQNEERLQTLEWMVKDYAEVTTGYQRADDEYIEYAEDYNPYVLVKANENGDILEKTVIGKGNGKRINSSLVKEIIAKGEAQSNQSTFLYVMEQKDDGTYLIAAVDTIVRKGLFKRTAVTLLLIAFAIGALVLVALHLSKYVTEPVERAINREKRFVADASHGLKTPIGVISVNAQALKLGVENNRNVSTIVTECSKMSGIIDRLLTLSRLEEVTDIQFREVSLSTLVTEQALTNECMAFERGITFDYDIEEDIKIPGVEEDVRELVSILTDNAIKNTPESGKVSITLKPRSRNSAILEVMNTGKGISQEDMPHIFERFYTTDYPGEKGSFGLGLAIARAIAENHNGSISVDSIPWDKTVFTVILPLKK